MTYDENDAAQYEYHLKDHLGNVRIAFSDKDGDGYIEPFSVNPNEPNSGTDDIAWDLTNTEILQESHYYPFGMAMDGAWQDIMNDPENNYLYNGKELNSDFGLDWLDYGARYYDPAIARWNAVDPMAEKFYSWSSYNYTYNNPIIFTDPDGTEPENIIIRVNASDDKNHGHAAIAVEEYGNKTGNVVVYELAGAPEGGEGEYKNAALFGQGVTPDYSSTTMSKEEFLKESKENYDGVVELPSTQNQDEIAHSNLQGKEDANTPYNPVTNNCATNTCEGAAPVTKNANFGKEKVSAKKMGVTITKEVNTPNATFNDAKKVKGAIIHKDAGDKTKVKFQKYIDNKS